MKRAEHAELVRRSQFRQDPDLISLTDATLRFNIDGRTLRRVIERGGLEMITVDGVANAPKLLRASEIEGVSGRKGEAHFRCPGQRHVRLSTERPEGVF
jgi:hypothetical protein